MTIVPDHESYVPVMVREYDTLCRYKIVLDNESNLLIYIMAASPKRDPLRQEFSKALKQMSKRIKVSDFLG